MTAMARTAGANRILSSGKIPHPVGDPTRSKEEEASWRKGVIETALQALQEDLNEPKIYG